MAMAWPYAVYTDPAFAASILQAAAASAGGLAAVAAANYAAYPPGYYPPRYSPYPLPRAAFPLPDMETPLLPPPHYCHPLSPTHSDTSGATLSPERRDSRERDRDTSPDNCDGSASCRCGIINCVAGGQYAPPVSLMSAMPPPSSAPTQHGHTPGITPLPLLVTSGSKPLQEPKKLFQPYKNDLPERA